jgi:hypothetical protein
VTSPAPIVDAIPIVRRSIYSALALLMSAYTAVHSDGLTRAKLYWTQAEQEIDPPFVVVQSQDGGGVDAGRIGGAVWSGLITLRAIAPSLLQAEALLNTIQVGMSSLFAPAGYSITAHHDRPLTLPPADGLWTAASIYRVTLART